MFRNYCSKRVWPISSQEKHRFGNRQSIKLIFTFLNDASKSKINLDKSIILLVSGVLTIGGYWLISIPAGGIDSTITTYPLIAGGG